MALSSRLFKGNRALEACAVQDSAHVTRGATGDHVGKIQLALSTLDGVQIDRAELMSQQYGRSTSAAVLAYKQKRQIINRSYQSAADDVVGKMTVASLDKEMIANELTPKPPGDCVQSLPGPPNPAGILATPPAGLQPTRFLTGSRTGQVTAPKQLGGFIRVFFQITLKSATEDGYPLSANIELARDTLFEHGISLSVEIRRGFADTIPFSEPILNNPDAAGDNVDQIRKVSEDVRPGVPGVFRVIVCQMVGDSAGETFRNRVINGRIVPPFALLNSQIVDFGRATLIHEMIHASKPTPKPGQFPHDSEKFSVFFDHGSEKPGGTARTFLRPEHALTLSTLSAKL